MAYSYKSSCCCFKCLAVEKLFNVRNVVEAIDFTMTALLLNVGVLKSDDIALLILFCFVLTLYLLFALWVYLFACIHQFKNLLVLVKNYKN